MGTFSENYTGRRCSDCSWADMAEARINELQKTNVAAKEPVNLNSKWMIEYEVTHRDSYVNCIDNIEIIDFQRRYITFLEEKLNN